ncbi:MAG TPA: FeoA family protein [Abditibacteriaceae bacterium]|nr:FeoA family protein [Abditibacteriaceae bacterium]
MPTTQTTLDQLQPGDQAKVLAIHGEPETAERLMEMGLVVGTPLKVLKFAPLGDPMEIVIRGYHLTLRRAEAAGIRVEV